MKFDTLIPKAVGADIELGILAEGNSLTQLQAARRVLEKVSGIPTHGVLLEDTENDSEKEGTLSLDMDRKWLTNNGASIYIDSAHPEMAHPICRSAREFVAVHRSLLTIMEDALEETNADLPEGRIRLFCDNSDGKQHSYGSHIDLLISARCFHDIFNRRGHYLQFLGSVFASGTVFGQGKTGSEFGSKVPYQLSQRADFFSRLRSLDTMSHRGLVNTRKENLCGSRKDLERFHIIFFDHNLSPINQWVKIGIIQIVLLLVEARMVPIDLILEDPVSACHAWSKDPNLGTRARLLSGEEVTVGEYHLLLLEKVEAFVNQIGWEQLDELVPGAEQIIQCWQDSARAFHKRDFAWLECRFDAYIKKSMLEGAIEQEGLDWDSPAIAMLDKLYSEIPNGMFFQLEDAGAIETMHTREELLRFREAPPSDTRAAVRSKILSTLPPETIREIDWDTVIFEYRNRLIHLELSDPLLCMGENSALSRVHSAHDLLTLLDGPPIEIPTNTLKNRGRRLSVIK